MKKKIKELYEKIGPIGLILLGIAFLFILWWIISFAVNSSLFPGPVDTFKELFYLMSSDTIWVSTGYTLLRLIISFAIAFIAAGILGTLAGIFNGFYVFLRPTILVLRTLPTAAIIYIIIVLVNIIYAPTIICFLVIFPLIYEAFVSGIKNIDPYIKASLALEGGWKHLRNIFKVILPLARPYIALGIVQSLGLGLKITIMAEIFCGNTLLKGLGRMLYDYAAIADMKGVFAISIMAIILIGIVDIALYWIKKSIKNRNSYYIK